MARISTLLCLALLAATLAATPPPATASTIATSYTGSFTQDDEMQLFPLHLGLPAQVTLVSFGYAGGTNAAGQAIPRGGFDSVLALFNAAGALLAQNDDGGFNVPTETLTGTTFDAYLSRNLAAGDYFIALAQFDNLALGPLLSSGFARTGGASFTTSFGCLDAQPKFNDVSGLPGCGRTGNWAFDVQVEAPEPASMALLGIALLGLAAPRIHRARQP